VHTLAFCFKFSVKDTYLTAPTTLNGSKSIALINLKTASRVRPIILNGNKISQISGSKKIKASANGQHITNKINHKKTAINVFIENRFYLRSQTMNQTVGLAILPKINIVSIEYSFLHTWVFKTVQR
jgi:hypothetical protein